MTPVPYDAIPVEGVFFLNPVSRPAWQLWRKLSRGPGSRQRDMQLVTHEGEVLAPPVVEEGQFIRATIYAVPAEHVEGIVMAARHLDADGWQRFVQRWLEKDPVGA